MDITILRFTAPTKGQVAILVIVAVVAGLAILILAMRLRASRGGRVGWNTFFQIARMKGLTRSETDLLRRLVQSQGLSKPTLVFTSTTILDSSIQRAVRKLGIQEIKGENKDDLINVYYRLRNKIVRSKGTRSLTSTREIPVEAKIRMSVEKYGTFSVTVNRNQADYIGVSVPILPPGKSIPWNKQKVKCSYWRENDAMYVFETRVMDLLAAGGASSICLRHTDRVLRQQKRMYPRKSVRLPVLFSRVKVVEEGGKKRAFVEKKDTHWGTIVDISVGGVSVETMAPFDRNAYIRVEFELKEDYKMVGFGKVRRIERNPSRLAWLMHIQFTKIDKKYRNEIFAVLYNYQTI